MSSGLLALLDDVTAIAKVAAASLDDAAAAATKASAKAAGIVIDDTAVTPRYVVGFSADRELPIIGRIAWGSLKNKLLLLLPGAIALSLLAPWAIMPLLMAGGLYLCFEGYEKVHEWVAADHGKGEGTGQLGPQDAQTLENTRVAGAIRTDLILSAEIMAIALASVEQAPFVTKVIALFAVAVMVTAFVYGLVAVIVKADDVGVVMARQRSGLVSGIGRGIVVGMPPLLKVLSVVGTLAMLWVGGQIVIHGLAYFGYPAIEKGIHDIAAGLGGGAAVEWLGNAALSGLVGLALGYIVDLAVKIATPLVAKRSAFTDF